MNDFLKKCQERLRIISMDEIIANHQRLHQRFSYRHDYWVDADEFRRIRGRQDRSKGAVVITDECGEPLGDNDIQPALARLGGFMVVIVWAERGGDAVAVRLAV